MCRLVACFGPPIPISRPVFGGTHSLARQSWEPRELLSGSVNADGWGVTWWPGGAERPVRIARAEPIWFDPDLPRLLGSLAASSILAALRNTTPGLPVDRTGLLPILRDRWAFALNGYVPAFRARHMRRLREQLPDGFYARLEGVSDAETLMHLALAAIAGGASPADALVDVRDRVAARLAPRETSPLTMVLADATGGTILHTTLNGAVNSLYLRERGELIPEGVVIASERLDGDEGWEPVPDHSIVEYGASGVRITPL
jgi:glutamine amidotransferase